MRCIHNTSLPLAELKHVAKIYCWVSSPLTTLDSEIKCLRVGCFTRIVLQGPKLCYSETSTETGEHQVTRVGAQLCKHKKNAPNIGVDKEV